MRFGNIYSLTITLCCSILTDGFRTFLSFRVVSVGFVKLRTSQYLATEALALDTIDILCCVAEVCTCITNQFGLLDLVVSQCLRPPLCTWNNLQTWRGSFTLCIVERIYCNVICKIVITSYLILDLIWIPDLCRNMPCKLFIYVCYTFIYF